MLSRPLHVVPAHPLQAHRLADRLRDDDRLFLGPGAAAVATAVVARAVVPAHDDIVDRRVQHQRDQPARPSGSGCACAGTSFRPPAIGDRAGRPDRRVLLVRELVRGRELRGRFVDRCVGIADARASRRRRCPVHLAHRAEQVAASGQPGPGGPLRRVGKQRRRLDRVVLRGSTTATRFPLTTICVFGNCFLSSVPTEISVRAERRRVNHTRVQHPGQPDVADIGRRAGDDRRDRRASGWTCR